MKKILVSGGDGEFAKNLEKVNTQFNIIRLNKHQMDVFNFDSVVSAIKIHSPDIFIHAGALTRPMIKHKEFPCDSIKSNIIGTSNVTIACIESNIKLVYISTDFVYPCDKGNYMEDSFLYPVNEYAWSKLGGECAVKLYKNSLILRVAMTSRPYPHIKAFIDSFKSAIYIDDACKIILKLLNETGTINIGGEKISLYDFAKQTQNNIEKIYCSDIIDITFPHDASMNIQKMKKILKND